MFYERGRDGWGYEPGTFDTPEKVPIVKSNRWAYVWVAMPLSEGMATGKGRRAHAPRVFPNRFDYPFEEREEGRSPVGLGEALSSIRLSTFDQLLALMAWELKQLARICCSV